MEVHDGSGGHKAFLFLLQIIKIKTKHIHKWVNHSQNGCKQTRKRRGERIKRGGDKRRERETVLWERSDCQLQRRFWSRWCHKKQQQRSRLVHNIKIIKRHISQLPTRVTSVYVFRNWWSQQTPKCWNLATVNTSEPVVLISGYRWGKAKNPQQSKHVRMKTLPYCANFNHLASLSHQQTPQKWDKFISSFFCLLHFLKRRHLSQVSDQNPKHVEGPSTF